MADIQRTILVVDDEPQILKVLKAYLDKAAIKPWLLITG
jgi:DNA-binding response OmpR family regulator